MTLYCKLQQVQLIKEIKLLEKLSRTVSSCSSELERCNGGSDTENWYVRLEKRIEDLSVSYLAKSKKEHSWDLNKMRGLN